VCLRGLDAFRHRDGLSSSDFDPALEQFLGSAPGVDSVADSAALAPGIAAIGVTCELALQPQYADMMTATNPAGQTVNRMIHLDENPAVGWWHQFTSMGVV
jgi:hypothetical protein